MSTTNPAVRFTRHPGRRHALWSFEPSIELDALAGPAGRQLAATVEDACESRDLSTLSLLLPELVEAGFTIEAAQVARVLLDFNQNHVPAISTAHLHNLAVGSYLHRAVRTVSELAAVADAMDDLEAAYSLGFAFGTSRVDGGESLTRSMAGTMAEATELQGILNDAAAGKPVVAARLLGLLSKFGLTTLARSLGDACARHTPSASDSLRVCVGAKLRHHVSATAGLEAQLAVLADNPGNVAARNSACACLVTLGRAQDGLDHLAVSLRTPTRYVANTLRRAAREAGYLNVSQAADQLGFLAETNTTKASLFAARILHAIGRREHADMPIKAATDRTGPNAEARIVAAFSTRNSIDAVHA